MAGTVRVWQGIRDAGRCRDCRKPITWLTTDAGRKLPFDHGYTARETVRDGHGRVWEIVSFDDFHKCSNRPRRGGSQRLF